MSTDRPDLCTCDEIVKMQWAEKGIEVNVMPLPIVVVEGTFKPFMVGCPHGRWWIAEPTGEQIMAWAETRTP